MISDYISKQIFYFESPNIIPRIISLWGAKVTFNGIAKMCTYVYGCGSRDSSFMVLSKNHMVRNTDTNYFLYGKNLPI